MDGHKQKAQMTPRERVLTAIKGGQADRVPWVEVYAQPALADKILGRRSEPSPGARLWLDIHEKLAIDNITYDFRPPYYAKVETHAGQVQIAEPWLKTWEDVEKLKGFLPDPNDDSYYEGAVEFLKQKGDYAAMASLRMGLSPVYNSMEYGNFIYTMTDEPELVGAAVEIYSEWCGKVVERVNELGFDLMWFSEDIAFTSGPMVTEAQYMDYLFPHLKKVADKIALPWIYHSDGNFKPLVDRILQYEPSCLANLEPPVMDIFKLKEEYGDRVCLLGNIDLHYTLTRGTVEETAAEVREKLVRVGKGGGYILASANGLAAYCIPENVLAMNDTLLEYGWY